MVRYQMVVHDGPLTMEQQAFLLAKQAKRVWEVWGKIPDDEIPHELSAEMRRLYQELRDFDLFMSGYAQGRE